LDKDIRSPKSVNIHPNGKKFYVNSLEGGKTVVYATGSNEKLKVIEHEFTEADSLLWSKPSGLYPFTHYKKNLNTFRGKPVESAFSHHGRYLWVPYYRRSYDINAQDPSAVAVIDTRTDSIVKLMETGPLPKMVAVSGDNRYVAITHWGNNTVGIINIEGKSPDEWYYEDCVTIQKKLILNYSLTASVNRDVNSGLCLRGTVFTPDGRYLLVGCMGGSGGIAVIDLQDFSYLGHVYGMMTNLRHLVIRNDMLYLSINKEGYIQRVSLNTFYEAIGQMENGKVTLKDWENCKVAAGARTIDITPDGRYVVAACNFSSRLVVVDTESFQEIARIKADSYPVGLDISKDGKFVYTTSQGRDGAGGNCVDIYQMDY
jgi:DNA-binding beta-propeller fold protein YncE